MASRRGLGTPYFLLFLLAAATSLTAIQLAPLPVGLLEIVSPAKLDLLVANATAISTESPTFAVISYDPPATLLDLVRLVGYLSLAYSALRLARSHENRRALARGLVALGGFIALAALVHRLLDLNAVFGLVAPTGQVRAPLGPLINPNHLAALLGLTGPMAIGMVIAEKGPPKLLAVLAATSCFAALLVAASRGGALGGGVAVLFSGVYWLRLNQREQQRGIRRKDTISRRIAVAVLVLSVAAVILVVEGKPLLDEAANSTPLGETSIPTKSAVWRDAVPLVQRHWIAGIGRGAFEAAFTGVQRDPRATQTHLENDFLQPIIDWGIPGTVVLAVLSLFAARQLKPLRKMDTVEIATIGGLVGLGVHSLFDFALDIPGVAVPTLIAIASLTPTKLNRISQRRFARAAIRGGAIVVGASVLLVAASSLGRQAREDANSVRSSNGTSRPSRALRAWNRHPADYVAAGLYARELLHNHDSRGFSVLNRSLNLAPKNASLHALAAETLFTAGHRQQALVEFALAIKFYVQRRPAIRRLLTLYPNDEEAVKGLPLSPSAMRVIVSECRAQLRSRVAIQYLHHYSSKFETDVTAWTLLAKVHLENQSGPAALAALNKASALARLGPESIALLTRAYAQAGSPQLGVRVANKALAGALSPRERGPLLEALAMAQEAADDLSGAAKTLHRRLAFAVSNKARARIHLTLARLATNQGNFNQATIERNLAKSFR